MKGEGAEARNRVVVRVAGGLGNQMFQYAAGRALALKTGADLFLDTSFYARGRHRTYELNSLPIAAKAELSELRTVRDRLRRWLQTAFPSACTPETLTYQEPHFHYDPGFELLQPPVRLGGYFQSPRYFAEHTGTIQSELTPPPLADLESLQWAERIRASGTTALHVRRGDYLSDPRAQRLFATCPIEYYVAAMQRLPGQGEVFVFSDEPAWAKTHLPQIKPLIFMGLDRLRPALADLWLMTLAHHHIIANSSFSWWAAWLAAPRKGMKIAPARWFRDPAIRDEDLISKDWMRL